MTTEAIKTENIRLTNDLYNNLYKEKMVAAPNAATAEMQRVTTVLADTEAEKNRLAGLIAEKNAEVKRWYDLYTKLYKEKVVSPDNSPAEEMQRLTAVLADAEAEKNRLAALIPEKDVEVKRWYELYTKLYEEKTVTPEHLTTVEMQRVTAVLEDTEAEKNRLAGMIAEKDAEVKRWYDLYTKLYADTSTAS